MAWTDPGASLVARATSAGGAGALIAAVYLVARRHLQAPIRQSESLVRLLADLTDTREHAVYGHSWRVGDYSRSLAAALGLDDDMVERVAYAGLLHDIGKVGVPDGVLDKQGPLDPGERAVMMGHAAAGAHIVGRAGHLAALAPIIRHHHEWWSGGGYPEGLAREAIPLGARIVAVADAFDTMTTDRPYRARRSRADALAEIRGRAGEQFDPAVVAALGRIVAEEGGSAADPAGIALPTLVDQARAEGVATSDA